MPELQGLRRIEHLDTEYLLYIFHHSNTLGGSIGTHAYVVLLPLRRIDGIYDTRSAELLVLADDGSCRILRYHESGIEAGLGNQERRQSPLAGYELIGPALRYGTQFRKGYRQKIEGNGQRLPWKLPADITWSSSGSTVGLSVALLTSVMNTPAT